MNHDCLVLCVCPDQQAVELYLFAKTCQECDCGELIMTALFSVCADQAVELYLFPRRVRSVTDELCLPCSLCVP